MTARAVSLWKRLSAQVSGAEWIALIGVAALLVAVHALQFAPVFGEADSARMAGDAAGWHFTGKVHLETTDYRMRTSPMYVHWLKTALDHGLRMKHVPRFMAWTSLVSSVIGLIAAYFLFRALVGRTGAAIASVLLSLAPVYWLSAGYGMSHGPGLTALLVALWVFSIALDEGRSPKSFFWISGVAMLFMFVALALKADLVLNGLAFPGLVYARRRLTWHTFLVSCAVVAGALLLQMAYGRALVTPLPSTQSTAQFATAFNERFPFELGHFGAGLSCITHAPGQALFVVGLVATAHQLLSKAGFRLAVFALAWGLPIVFFWGFMTGNSARHNLSAIPALVLLTGAFIVAVTEAPWRAAAFAAAVVVGNYFSDRVGETGGFGTLVPRSDVLELIPAVTAKSEEMQVWARGFGRLPGPRKAVVARYSLPFALYEVLKLCEGEKDVTFDGKNVVVTAPDGSKREIRSEYATSPAVGNAALRAFRDQGFTVWRRDF
jgi:hypothetical protein